MKLSQLKKIIKEEIDKSRSLFVSPDDISGEDVINPGNEYKYTSSPDETLINKLFASKKLRDRFSGQPSIVIAKELGISEPDEETLSIIDDLMKSELYDERY